MDDIFAPGGLVMIPLFLLTLTFCLCHHTVLGSAFQQVQFIIDLYETIEMERGHVKDLELLNGRLPYKKPLKSPYEVIQAADENHTRQGDGVVEWIAGYSGGAFGFEVTLIVAAPIAIAQLMRIWRKFYMPEIKFQDAITDFPLVPLASLQHTQDELRVTREKRNGVEWLSTKFIIFASDNYVDLREIGKKAQKQDTGQNSPWMLLRLLVEFNGLYVLNQIETKHFLRPTDQRDSIADKFHRSEHFDEAGNFIGNKDTGPKKKKPKKRRIPVVNIVEKKSEIVQTNSKSLFQVEPVIEETPSFNKFADAETSEPEQIERVHAPCAKSICAKKGNRCQC